MFFLQYKVINQPKNIVECLIDNLHTQISEIKLQNIIAALYNNKSFEWSLFVQTIQEHSLFPANKIPCNLENKASQFETGGSGIIRKASLLLSESSRVNVVMKQLKFTATSDDGYRNFAKEFIIAQYLSILNEQCFIKSYGFIGDENDFHIIYEEADNDMFLLLQTQHFATIECKEQILSNMLAAIVKLHNLGFVHVDIKPENFLYQITDDQKTRIMIADFGAVSMISNPDIQYGTHGYRLTDYLLSHPITNNNPLLVDIFAFCITYLNSFANVAIVNHTYMRIKSLDARIPTSKAASKVIDILLIFMNINYAKMFHLTSLNKIYSQWEELITIINGNETIDKNLRHQYNCSKLTVTPNFKLIRFLHQGLSQNDLTDLMTDINHYGKYFDLLDNHFGLMVINSKGLKVIYNNKCKLQEFLEYVTVGKYNPKWDLFPLTYSIKNVHLLSSCLEKVHEFVCKFSDIEEAIKEINKNEEFGTFVKESKYKVTVVKNQQDDYYVLYPEVSYLNLFLQEITIQ